MLPVDDAGQPVDGPVSDVPADESSDTSAPETPSHNPGPVAMGPYPPQALGLIDFIGRVRGGLETVRDAVDVTRGIDMEQLKLFASEVRAAIKHGSAAVAIGSSILEQMGRNTGVISRLGDDQFATQCQTGNVAVSKEAAALCDDLDKAIATQNVAAIAPILIELLPVLIELIGNWRKRRGAIPAQVLSLAAPESSAPETTE